MLSRNTSIKVPLIVHPLLAFPEPVKTGGFVDPPAVVEVGEPGSPGEEPGEVSVGAGEPVSVVGEPGEVFVGAEGLVEVAVATDEDDAVVCGGQFTKTVFASRLMS